MESYHIGGWSGHYYGYYGFRQLQILHVAQWLHDGVNGEGLREIGIVRRKDVGYRDLIQFWVEKLHPPRGSHVGKKTCHYGACGALYTIVILSHCYLLQPFFFFFWKTFRESDEEVMSLK